MLCRLFARAGVEMLTLSLLTVLSKMMGGAYAGDWNCPNCDATVFASKNSCYKCQTPKPAGTGGGGGGGGYGANHAPCALAAQNVSGLTLVFRTRAGGGGGGFGGGGFSGGGGFGGGGGGGFAGGGGGGFGGPQVRPGDWGCPSCGSNVFASKRQCFKCGTSKPGEEGSYGGGGGGCVFHSFPFCLFATFNHVPRLAGS